MKTIIKSFGSALAIFAVAGVGFFSQRILADESPQPTSSAALDDADKPATTGDDQAVSAGISANMYFTDEHGNRREPTAAEIKQAAEAFQKDLARLAGKHKGKHYVQTAPNGTVSATVGVSKLQFLTVKENADGTLTFGHSTMDDDGNVSVQPAIDLPEM